MDPQLARIYSMIGRGIFAADVDGLTVFEVNDQTNDLESWNRDMREGWQGALFSPLFVFGGEPFLAHYYATVPGLADEQGRQPVVWVDAYESGYALPAASNVDRLFETYSRYLEELVAHEDFKTEGSAALTFPWRTPHLLARDEQLVRLIREGHFDKWLPGQEGKDWTARVLAAHQRLT
ncbi:hypothetical protein HPC49_51560 [Pyxidicoccus fallax]|uniref:Knr4/Smi1-like domain-containing protein n=1 Tax=Pyxidicoccus fallax TaxID=394095 RepID=A0A848LTJ1_9BACT|nr:hypothetical protein [Pyxidicoccus fallax]NMO21265.1 hypothetical protein [Pyxidicoccus fallax]NPC86611.1 hypothetical protein [Pyxidicoccus fallax]